MMPDPARSRFERGRRLAGHSGHGYSLLELLFVIAIILTVTAIAIPSVLAGLDAARTGGAARYLAARLNLARMEAVKRSAYVALRIEGPDTGYRYTFYLDGNRNGVRTRDIDRGFDRPIAPADRLGDHFAGVVFGILDGVTAIDGSALQPGSDPVRFGSSDLLSFSALGTATAGTFYLHGRRKQQMAVRVLGVSGRVRILRFDFRTAQWVSP